MADIIDPLEWLRATCAEYRFEPIAVFRDRANQPEGAWPMVIDDQEALVAALRDRGYFLPLPREPAALANVIEVSVTSFLAERAAAAGIGFTRGRERSYPDLELHGAALGDAYFAVDVKVARRKPKAKNTISRITLYTGNTYFKHPSIRWGGSPRPFDSYARHLDVVVLYEHDATTEAGVSNVEMLAHDAWRIASRQRSSTTREYIGAVKEVAALRDGRGEFATEAEFYKFWRAYKFKTGAVVDKLLEKLVRQQSGG